MAADPTDVRLRERLVAGDDSALAEAYDRWAILVRTVASRILNDEAAADDITQDVFVRLWECPHEFDPARAALRTWLCIVARSRALDLVRRRMVRDRHVAAAWADREHSDVDDALIWNTETKVVRDAVRSLPDAQRTAVLLAYYEGLTYREVARRLDIPEGTAKSRLRVALAALADRLDAEGILER
jgi:RNA polymerase sigma-70 factor, ECF subfamily